MRSPFTPSGWWTQSSGNPIKDIKLKYHGAIRPWHEMGDFIRGIGRDENDILSYDRITTKLPPISWLYMTAEDTGVRNLLRIVCRKVDADRVRAEKLLWTMAECCLTE